MNLARTDLALEAHEAAADAGKGIEGVRLDEENFGDFSVKRVQIENEDGAKRLGKRPGTYVTIEAPRLRSDPSSLYRSVSEALRGELSELLNLSDDDCALVIGLGNRRITPDALGPRTIDRVLATRHMVSDDPARFGGVFRSVCALSPGVLGITGIDTTELVSVISREIKPALVIVVDALAARSASRLAATFQLSDTGVSPGSGVNGCEREISRDTLGVPVISLGVPTVMDAAALAADVMHMGRREAEKTMGESEPRLFVTPNNIDMLIESASSVMALAINGALHPKLSADEIESFMSG